MTFDDVESACDDAFYGSMTPLETDPGAAPIGSFLFDETPDLHGRALLQVRAIPIADLVLPELRGGLLAPEKAGCLPSYVARVIAGEKAPRISVIELEDGRLRVVDGHRRTLARLQAGYTTIEALVSPVIHAPEVGGCTTLTRELMLRHGMPDACRQALVMAERNRQLTDALAVDGLAIMSDDDLAAWNRHRNDGGAPQPELSASVWEDMGSWTQREVFLLDTVDGEILSVRYTVMHGDWEGLGTGFVLERAVGAPEGLLAPIYELGEGAPVMKTRTEVEL